MVQTNLSKQEVEERTRILRNFRQALIRQRERFRQYLEMLEHNQGSPAGPDTDPVDFQFDMEKSIVREIATFEQVIEPLELMYRENDPDGAAEIPNLRAALERTREEVVRRTEVNRDILKSQISALRREISGLRVMKRHQSLYATPAPATIDISA